MHCLNCHLLIDEDDAYHRGAAVYCCERCANHQGCACNHERTPEGERKLY